jgi:G3E family GTPase
MNTLRRDLDGVVRAKGFFWTAEAYDRVGLMSLAGNVVRADRIGKWFITLRNEGEVQEENMPDSIRAVWDERLGDRRQEMVFIGVDLDRKKLQARLEACFADAS